MKQSHYTTPRTLDECYFDPRGQAFFPPEDRHPSLIRWILDLILPSRKA